MQKERLKAKERERLKRGQQAGKAKSAKEDENDKSKDQLQPESESDDDAFDKLIEDLPDPDLIYSDKGSESSRKSKRKRALSASEDDEVPIEELALQFLQH